MAAAPAVGTPIDIDFASGIALALTDAAGVTSIDYRGFGSSTGPADAVRISATSDSWWGGGGGGSRETCDAIVEACIGRDIIANTTTIRTANGHPGLDCTVNRFGPHPAIKSSLALLCTAPGRQKSSLLVADALLC